MPSTTLPNAVTTAIAKGLRAHLESLGIEVKHTDLLAGIARGLGFANIQSMRAICRQADVTVPSCSFSGKVLAGYRTRFLVEVLSDDDDIGSLTDLDEIHYEITFGGSVGLVSHIETTPLDRSEMSSESIRMGSSPDFFLGHEDEDAEDDEQPDEETIFIVRALFHRPGETAPDYGTLYRIVAADETGALAKAKQRAEITRNMKNLGGAEISLTIEKPIQS